MKPKTGLVIEQLPEGGLLVLDEKNAMSHTLAREAAAVWQELAKGSTEIEALADRTGLDQTTVAAALAQIDGAGLLEREGLVEEVNNSRRAFFAKAATIAGAAIGLKMVESLAIPSPAAAQSADNTQDSDT